MKRKENASPERILVLYEDNHLIAVNKPSGVPVQADASGALSLMDMTREYIRKTYCKPGKVFLGLVHRLDRPVSGVVLFARTSKAASRISAQLRSRTVEKIYLALVHGEVTPPSGILSSYLKKGEKKVHLVGQGEEEAKHAILSYRTLRTMGGKSLLEIRLHTGRKHQIRVQLAGSGNPVEGDLKYGAPYSLSGGKIRLMSLSLTFKHPTREERITIAAPYPDWGRMSKQ
jgi:23S rRNA pseudouridine1911/1915/1917 synthase